MDFGKNKTYNMQMNRHLFFIRRPSLKLFFYLRGMKLASQIGPSAFRSKTNVSTELSLWHSYSLFYCCKDLAIAQLEKWAYVDKLPLSSSCSTHFLAC